MLSAYLVLSLIEIETIESNAKLQIFYSERDIFWKLRGWKFIN